MESLVKFDKNSFWTHPQSQKQSIRANNISDYPKHQPRLSLAQLSPSLWKLILNLSCYNLLLISNSELPLIVFLLFLALSPVSACWHLSLHWNFFSQVENWCNLFANGFLSFLHWVTGLKFLAPVHLVLLLPIGLYFGLWLGLKHFWVLLIKNDTFLSDG